MPKLFSYGTLQLPQVQKTLFGRELVGHKDLLRKYRLSDIEITDPEVLALSGQRHHPILEYTGDPQDSVAGSLLELTEEEVLQADSYEVAAYRRDRLVFASGETAYAYLKNEAFFHDDT